MTACASSVPNPYKTSVAIADRERQGQRAQRTSSASSTKAKQCNKSGRLPSRTPRFDNEMSPTPGHNKPNVKVVQ
jgi:hypothetical protein